MKLTKRILAVSLAIVLMFAMAIPAFAAADGTITINGTTAGKTYDVYKILDLTYSGSNVSYTIDADWVDFFIGSSALGKDYLSSTAIDDANQVVYDGTIYYLNITEDNVAEVAQKALEYCSENTADATQNATGTSLVFDNLAYGYYLVFPQGATEIKDGNASICSLTSTLKDATVNVKADYPTIDKKAGTTEDKSVEVGETVTFTITGEVPDTTGYDTYSYVISDTMSAGLTFNSTVSNMQVKFGDDTITAVAPVYTANNGFTLTYDMTNYQTYKGQTITVTYNAVVNQDAITNLTQNKATLTYSNDPADPTSTFTTPEGDSTSDIYTSKISATNVDADDNTIPVEDATFVLKNEDDKYVVVDPTTGAISWTDDIDDATTFTSDENGEFEVPGLKDGTYYLVETDAPDGYNLIPDPIEVTITSTTDANGNVVGSDVEATIPHQHGFELPSTGGVGTTIFFIIGGVLFAGAVVLLISKKRKSSEN